MKLKQIVKKIWRYPLCRHYRRRLKANRFTIISSDCVGGCLYHDLGMRFASPTINLVIPNFLGFVERLDYYLRQEPIAAGHAKSGVPIIRLDDLMVVGVHYSSHAELMQAWNRRRTRIEWDRIVLMTNSRIVSTEEDVERFKKLPYPKVLFTKNPPQNDFEVYAPALQKGADLTAYCDLLGRRYFEKYLDCVKFLNESVG